MQFLNYLLISVISYLGILVGYFLLLFAPEEKQPGMKYFTRINIIIALLAAFLAISLGFKNIVMQISFLIFMLLMIFYKKNLIYITYIFFSLIFYLFSDSLMAFSILAVIIFAYGLTAGAIIFDQKGKKLSLIKCFYPLYFILIAALLKTFL